MRRSSSQRTGSAPEAARGSEPIVLTVVLRRSDPAGFEAFLRDLYEPRSPNFRQFLTAEEISDRFGPAPADYDAVLQYFVQRALQLTGPLLRL